MQSGVAFSNVMVKPAVLTGGAMFCASFVLALMGLGLAMGLDVPTYLWLANTIAFGMLVRRAHADWGMLLAGFMGGELLAYLLVEKLWLAALGYTLGDAAGVLLGAWLARKFVPQVPQTPNPTQILLIFAACLLVAAPVSAVIYGLVKAQVYVLPLKAAIMDRWVCLAVGAFLFTLLAVTFDRSDLDRWSNKRHLLVLLSSFLLMSTFTVTLFQFAVTPFVFLSLPLTVLAIALGAKDAAIVAVGTLTVWGAGQVFGWWSPPPILSVVREFKQAWIAGAFACFYPFFIGTIADKLRVKEKRLAEALQKISTHERQLKQFIDNAPFGVARVSSKGQLDDANQALCKLIGKPKDLLDTISERELLAAGKRVASPIPQDADSDVTADIRTFVSAQGEEFTVRVSTLYPTAEDLSDSHWLLVENISGDMKYQQQLEAAKLRAENETRAKTNFVANISHEIRTPMTAVLGVTQLLAKSGLNATQQQYVDMIQSAGQNLMRLLNDVLDFSKIEAGRMDLLSEPFSLTELLQNLRNFLSIEAQKKGLQWSVDAPPELPASCLGDETRLQQLLINLVSNAVKFTEKGAVTLSLACVVKEGREANLQFRVTDTGIGISPSQQERIFEAFNQADSTITRRFGGTGLGLAICRNIAGLMNGALTLNSAPNEGSTFTFTLVLPVHTVAQRPLLIDSQPSPGKSKTARLRGIRLLIAEDDDAIRTVVNTIFHHEGADVVIVESGAKVLETLAQSSAAFDAILMDVQMPGMDGCETTRRLQEAFKLDTPVIALTAGLMEDEISRCREAGMCGYIAKPLDIETAVDTLLKTVRGGKPATFTTPAIETIAKAGGEAMFNIQYLLDTIGEAPEELENIEAMIRRLVLALPQSLEQAHMAILEQQFDLAASIFHKLRGSVSTLGARSLIELSRRIEKTLLNRDAAAIPPLLTEVDQAVAALITQARQWLKGRQAAA